MSTESAALGSSLDLTWRALRPWMSDESVTELCINRPGECFIESSSGWRQERLPFADFDWCLRLAKLIANYSHQRIDAAAPLLSAALPTGERVQIAMPPACESETVAISIRRPSGQRWSLAELSRRGIFRRTQRTSSDPSVTELALAKLLAEEQFEAFMRLAVRTRQNIVVSGPTGSGKTTWAKALIGEIAPEERLITIEDARELVLDRHPNHVRLYYSKDDQGEAAVRPRQLLEACLRMRPDRVLLAELRSDEAFDYLRNVNSGHPGSITSVHATRAELAFEQLVLLIKQSPGGQGLAREDIRALLYQLVDVVIQFALDRQERYIQEIWYEPGRKRDAA
jgi:type IV secretion system protein VirB11